MNRYTYEELWVGQKEEFSVTVTEEMLDGFRSLTGDINPLHREDRFAQSRHYPQKVVFGMLTASFLSTLAGVYLPGENCLIQSVEVKFVKPVYIGEILHISGEVAALHDSVRQVELKVTISKARGGGKSLTRNDEIGGTSGMNGKKENKILLITGASSEVGCRFIRDSAEDYSVVLAHYRHSNDALDRLKAELGEKIVLLQADFLDLQSVNAMLDQIVALGCSPDHIVHLPAQKVNPQKFHKTDVEQYCAGFTVSVASLVLVLKRFIPNMSKQKYGKILLMLTSFTLNAPPKYQAPYITVKYALLGLMRDLAREYAEKGITVNGISPDMMETKFLSDMPELVIQQNAANNPAGRNLVVEDVVPTIRFLLSDQADMITGQNIGVTGGK